MSSRRKNNNNKGRVMKREMDMTHPPQLATSLKYTHTFRFIATANISARSLLISELLDLICQAATTTSAYRLVSAVKVKRVRVWAATSVATSSLTVIFERGPGTTGASGDSVKHSDTALGVAQVAYIDVRFNEREQIGQWQPFNSTSQYGVITIPSGGLIDITFSSTVQDSSAPVAVTRSISGATVGQVYCLPLDNSQATAQLTAVGWVTV